MLCFEANEVLSACWMFQMLDWWHVVFHVLICSVCVACFRVCYVQCMLCFSDTDVFSVCCVFQILVCSVHVAFYRYWWDLCSVFQILMCSVYGVCKVMERERRFRTIVQEYRNMPHADPEVVTMCCLFIYVFYCLFSCRRRMCCGTIQCCLKTHVIPE